MLVDTHCHLDFPDFDLDREEVIRRAKSEGIGCIVNIGSSLEGSKRAVELSRQYNSIYATVGLHPHEADGFDDDAKIAIEKLSREDKVVAIGETGLDYFKNYSKAENQKVLFRHLVRLAKGLDLPLVIHSRQAQDDTLSILNEAMPLKCVVHCFSGDEDFLRKCLGLGFLVSFTCNITYKKAQGLRDIVKLTPLDRMMLETDAPFLPPEGMRGKRNEPAYVKILAEEIARIKDTGIDEISRATTENAKKFYNLP